MRNAVAAGLLVTSVALLLPSTPTAADVADLRAVDRAARTGLQASATETYGAVQVDYNQDGRQDVWVGYHGRGAKLWKNRGDGTYTRVARTAWPAQTARGGTIDRHDCAWADVDRNGLVDAYCSTGRMWSNIVKGVRGNELWLQRRPGRFREVGERWDLRDVCGRGRQVVFFDANGDRFPDMFLGNDVARDDPDDPCDVAANNLPNERSKVFINQRGQGFRYVRGGWALPAGVGTRCAHRVDFDGDGWDDLLACRGFNETPRLYRNRRGRGFVDVSARHELVNPFSAAVVADLDRDGDQDVVTASAEGFAYHHNTRGRFGARRWVGQIAAGEGLSVAVADIDLDGDRDVYGMVGESRRVNADDQIWVDEGTGFSPLAVPAAGGAADEVVTLTPQARRRPGFLVLNGYGSLDHGPVQLIKVVNR